MSKDLGRLECEDGSISNNSKEGQSSTTYSNILKTKDSANPMRRSSTKTKDFLRMSTLKSDSSQGSSKFKFRAAKQKCNVFVQTDRQIFKLFLQSKMNQYILQSKSSRRNKIVQTEEVVTQTEEERRKELLANYGHKMYSSGDVNFRGVSIGENNEIKYSKQSKDVMNAILAKSIQLLNPIKSIKKKNEKTSKHNEFLKITPQESSTSTPRKRSELTKHGSVNIRIDTEEEKIVQSISKTNKSSLKNNDHKLSMNSFKIEKITQSLDSVNEEATLSQRSKCSENKSKKVSFNKNSNNESSNCGDEDQNIRRNSKFEAYFDQL